MHKLNYISETVLAELKANVPGNLERYREVGFDDLASQNGWSMELGSVEYNPTEIADLDGTGGSEAEIRNSRKVFGAIRGMTAALATEERIWTRLTHLECLDYARKRWALKVPPKEKSGLLAGITGQKEKQKEEAKQARKQNISQVEKHYFAKGRTGSRDDNAISRLWWNAYIAQIVDPGDPDSVLNEILKSADIRQALIERPMLSNRTALLRGIIKCMRDFPDITGSERIFRDYMIAINFRGGGILFEAMEAAEINEFLKVCREDALKKTAAKKVAA